MVDYVDMQYVTMLSGRYGNFSIKHRAPLKVNFRCPVCGDSQKSQKKARGWIIENPKTSSLFFNCFNCGASQSFMTFLKSQDAMLYNDYVADKFLGSDKKPVPEEKPKVSKSNTVDVLSKIKKISQLKHDHPVKEYITKRKIPTDQHFRVYYAPKFKLWINSIIPGKLDESLKDEPRLIFPLKDKEGVTFGVSARSFKSTGLRYITIMFDDRPKIFGLDRVDFSKPYYILEGAIDSLFISNSIAMVGADGNTSGLENPENAVFVFDAEPRNLEITKRMQKVVSKGFKLCIWPHSVPGKDVNEMFLSGSKDIKQIIDKNTYSGLDAELRLADWRKTK